MSQKQWVDFAKVRERLLMTDVLSHYDIEHQTGRTQIKVHCPFHDDSTPSCSINTEKRNFKCFGCDAKGNALDFIILMEGGDKESHPDRHSASLLAVEIMGEDLQDFKKGAASSAPKNSSKPTPAGKKSKPKKAEPKEPVVTENKVFDRVLQLDSDHPFLETRGVSPDLAEQLGLGFCARGIMKDRIAIPIQRHSGECVGYVGRWADDEVPTDKEKYHFPKGFQKSLELWNIHRALTLEKRFLVLVEGYWSAIRLHELGIPVAAIMGTSVSPQQAKLIRDLGYKYTVLLLDGDDAGRNATKEAAYILSQQVYVFSVELPEGEKPDSVEESFLSQFM